MHQQHDDDSNTKRDCHRTGKGAALVTIDNNFRDFPDGHIPPFSGLGVLKGGHRGGCQQGQQPESDSPIQDNSPRKLIKSDESQVADQGTPERAVKDIKADGKEGQHKSGDATIEQERGLHETANAFLAAIEVPEFVEARQVFLAPFNKLDILVDHKLDAVGHGFQAGQGDHSFHGGSNHMQDRLTKRGLREVLPWQRRQEHL